jgi:hypothetical protein
MASRHTPKVALVWRGDAEARARGAAEQGRFPALFLALARAGFAPEPCVYDEAFEAEVRAQLLACDAALVWVNPLQGGIRRREGLNALLRGVADAGVRVSAHPDVIAKLGVKAVLPRTAALGWSGDARFYADPVALAAGLPQTLAGGARVLKQNRGNDGVGVWKLEDLGEGRVRVTEAASGSAPATVSLAGFLGARIAALADAGGYVDQAWQPRIAEGMVRCYLSGDRVVGFGHHLVRALAPPDAGPGGPRLYSGADDARFQGLRQRMEGEWTPELARILDIASDALPVIWDADFLLGPRDGEGEDSWVLCEVNVSSVYPFPEQAPAEIARTLLERLPAQGARPDRAEATF